MQRSWILDSDRAFLQLICREYRLSMHTAGFCKSNSTGAELSNHSDWIELQRLGSSILAWLFGLISANNMLGPFGRVRMCDLVLWHTRQQLLARAKTYTSH